jgi:hypothetical protein
MFIYTLYIYISVLFIYSLQIFEYDFLWYNCSIVIIIIYIYIYIFLMQPTISLEMPVPSQGHYGFHNFLVVDWFCLFIYLWVLIYFIFLVFPCFILLFVLVICAFFHTCMLLMELSLLILAKEYLLHLINKCSSSSTASQLHCLHILFSTAVFGIVYLPLSISRLAFQ